MYFKKNKNDKEMANNRYSALCRSIDSENTRKNQRTEMQDIKNFLICPVDPNCSISPMASTWFKGSNGHTWDFCARSKI